MIVSHDARLLTMTNCEMWLMDNQTVTPIEGGYEGYRESLLKDMEFVGNCINYMSKKDDDNNRRRDDLLINRVMMKRKRKKYLEREKERR